MHGMWNNGFNNMMNFEGGSGWFIVYDIIRFIVIVTLIIVIGIMLIKRSSGHSYSKTNRATEIVKERYASGEISEEEFKNKLKILNERW